jgi:DNA polymerase V
MQTLDAICGVSATTGLLPTATGYAVVEANPGKLEQGCTVVLSLYGSSAVCETDGVSLSLRKMARRSRSH